MSILVTGGTGYIGSHACVELLEAGYEVVIVDNFHNSKPAVLDRIFAITGKEPVFYELDLLDEGGLNRVFSENPIEAVMHFAGLKAVGESVELPLNYYHSNLTGTLHLLEAMRNHNVKRLVFSSSATVYGVPEKVPISEDFPLSATNPYGRTKLMIEEMLRDIAVSDPDWSIGILRYFNPIGAHESGKIGEDPGGIPNNLLPYISQVAAGKLEHLNVFGIDYPTFDGTGVRDYIHVVDLARGHIKALERLFLSEGIETYNLGTGKGYSVLQMVSAFEEVSGKKIPYRIAGRRRGDVAECYADPRKAESQLGWKAEKGMADMCRDAWRWQSANPDGYSEKEPVFTNPDLVTSAILVSK
ncbi:UDP-glucose 4-epimerase GalE [Rossellomorea vietnamensis]|uniref:UDP-glucose 4-epimerase n=1 Tax=Rossellomorea vietnamensis TaxID=218284 RepID=A0A5D4K9I6_9BACI|nr:UDP-glucose 4-epimerase GalE [Rossellomorea vietnamensis]TYR73415.1 UDP-glucose 4-epimerase GalE [Rossellomorea vietnamensis]